MSDRIREGFVVLVLVWILFSVAEAGLGFLRAGGADSGDYDRGQCQGWADSAGLVAAWDAEGACVLGSYPALGVE